MCRTRFPSSGRSLWQGIFLADISDPASPKVTLAKRGALLSDSPDKLRLHLEDGTQQESVPKAKDQYSITTFDSTEIPIQLPSSAEHAARPASGRRIGTARACCATPPANAAPPCRCKISIPEPGTTT